MAYFVWADDMVIDNGTIDQDHRKLVDQVNALHTATIDGRGNEIVGQLLERVIADTEERKPPAKSSVIWVRDKRRWCPLIFKWTPIYAHVISAALFITPHTPKLQRCLQSPSRG